jgi:hypothetical protein
MRAGNREGVQRDIESPQEEIMNYRARTRTAILFSTTVILGLTVVGSVGTAANTQPTLVIPYGATDYKYQVVPFDDGLGFEQPGFDDSAFALGDAGFGTPAGGCELNNPVDVLTPWAGESDILVRKEFELPPRATNVVVNVAIDNDVSVFVNGYEISSGLQMYEGCTTRDRLTFAVPDSILQVGTNLLAVRGRDRGALAYLDVQVTADISTVTRLGRASR